MGDEACRPGYLELLRAYLAERGDQLCAEHRGRLDANPLRVLDCKRPECRAATADAPRLIDHLCEPCAAHFGPGLRRVWTPSACPTCFDHRLVRGFDYYTRTTFEFASEALESAQNGIGGGGRYDGLVEMLGGPPTPGIGFGIGIERLLLACDAEGVFAVRPAPLDAFVVDVAGGESARDLTAELRGRGLRGRPGLRRPVDEVPAEGGRPVGGPGGADRGPRRGGRGYGDAAAPAGHRGPAHRAARRGGRGRAGPVRPRVTGRPRRYPNAVPPSPGPHRDRTRKDHP